METSQTIDVKGLEHAERERRVFSSLENLKIGEELRILLEFNPLPLVYLLKAREEFMVTYEKEGPDEWILAVKRTGDHKPRKEDLRELLKGLKKGELTEEKKARAKEFFKSVDAKTIGDLEQELIREGVSHEEVRKSLCDIHLEVMKDSLVEKRAEVSAPHPVHTFMEEHAIIQEKLRALARLVERIKGMGSFEDFGDDLTELQDIAHHLLEAESHHQREEDVLFPVLESHDVVEPPRIMKLDHAEFRKRKKELFEVAHHHEEYDFASFKDKVVSLGEYLVRELDGHIFREDNILYQIALQVLNPEEWEYVKEECDRIGYCCFTPEAAIKEEVVELDLRSMPPFERHAKIFQTWESLKPGQALRLINDHDPKPLHYQFEAEQKGKYEWQYEEQGPVNWKVKIKRI